MVGSDAAAECQDNAVRGELDGVAISACALTFDAKRRTAPISIATVFIVLPPKASRLTPLHYNPADSWRCDSSKFAVILRLPGAAMPLQCLVVLKNASPHRTKSRSGQADRKPPAGRRFAVN